MPFRPDTERRLSDNERKGLPAWTYFSDELLEIERSELFRRTWQCVGHVSNVPNPGDYLALDMVGERALIVRDKEGCVRAFHNVCRHRGSRIVADSQGHCRSSLVCPFHGWSYALDGTLRAVPLAKTFANLDPVRDGLKPLEHEIWNGFVFVRFCGGQQPSVHKLLAPFAADFAPYKLDRVHPLRPITTETVAANWKSVRDVDNEGYHVAIAHPALQDLYGGRYEDRTLAFGVSRSEGIMNEGAAKLWSVRHYKKILPDPDHLPNTKKRSWLYYGLYPNLVFMLYPDSVGFYQEFPIAVDRTVQRFAYYGLPDERREMKLARYLSSRIDRDTGREDSQLIVWSCEAARSSAYRQAHLSDVEAGVRDYHDFLRQLIPVVDLESPPEAGSLAAVNVRLRDLRGPVNWN